MKKYINADDIIKTSIVDEDLWELEDLMKEKPNFNKSEGAKKVFERKCYMILAVKKGFVIYNRNKSFEEGHSHVRGYNMAKTIIDNCIKCRIPKTRNLYLLSSHVRISDDEKYINKVNDIIEAKKSKEKLKYINKRTK